MIKPASYFDLIPRGDLLLRTVARRTSRAINLCGFPAEVKKVLTAIMLRYPLTHILTADEYRSHATESLVADYHEGSIIVVGYPRHAKGLDRVTLQVTSYTTAQIARQIGADIDHLADAETAVDAQLLGRMTLAGEVARACLQLHYPKLAENARQHLKHLEENQMFTPEKLKSMSPEDYKNHRRQILSGQYQAEVQLQIDRAKREASDAAHAANPNAYKIRALKESRDEHARKGRNVEAYDRDIARLQAEQEQEQKRKAFETSTEYESVVEVSMKLRDVVAKYDPSSLPAVDAELTMYREHQSTERLNANLVRVSRDAWMKELAETREARFNSAKVEHEAARADLQREQERATNNELRSQFVEGSAE